MKPYSDLHPIQERILKKLGYKGKKEFSEIKGDVESNKFAFHVNKLKDEELITETKKGYKLTSQGREILPYFDLDEIYHPVIVVDLLVFSKNKVYLVPKEEDPLDPFQGNYRALSKRISKNDRLEAKATEIFESEFGHKPDNIEKCGVFDSQVTFKDDSKQHYLVFYFKTELDNHKDEDNWFSIDELDSLDLLPGLEKTVKKLQENESYFLGSWDLCQSEESFDIEELTFE